MRILSRLLDLILNRCPSCGLAALAICDRCWFTLNEMAGLQAGCDGLHLVDTDPFVQRALYLWDDRDETRAAILRDIILSSKESPSDEMMKLWADEFARRSIVRQTGLGKKNWLILAPPGRSGFAELDHAGALAKSLSEASSGFFSYEPGALERVGESRRVKLKSQKIKTREERSQIEFRISPTRHTRIADAVGFLFIDDVIATGATARAAWIALGKPKVFECWAIAHKVKEEITLQSLT